MYLADDYSCKLTWRAKSKDYYYHTCDISLGTPDTLAVVLRGGTERVAFAIDGIRSKTMLQVLEEQGGSGPYGRWGMPFHDCLSLVYKDLGLDFGYIAPLP